jgi:hypothetical protein
VTIDRSRNPPAGATALRVRLLALRQDALQQLAASEVIDAGLMRLVADAGAVLAVLEVEAIPTPKPEEHRCRE